MLEEVFWRDVVRGRKKLHGKKEDRVGDKEAVLMSESKREL